MSEPREQRSGPTDEQIVAMIGLLGDDRGPLQESAHARLLAWGEQATKHLHAGAQASHMQTRTRCRALLRAIEVRGAVERVGELRLDKMGEAAAPVLLEGVVLAARMVRTFVPEPRALAAKLRREAATLRSACIGRSLPVCARLLSERLHEGLGLRGCDPALLDVDQRLLVANIFEGRGANRGLLDRMLLDRVLVNGEGAPVVLSLVYLLVARWAGLTATGVALPDHFLIRLHGPRPLLIDPFHGGRVVTKSDCVRYLRSNGYPRPRDHLRDLNDREVLVRYFESLAAVSRLAAPSAGAAIENARARLQRR